MSVRFKKQPFVNRAAFDSGQIDLTAVFAGQVINERPVDLIALVEDINDTRVGQEGVSINPGGIRNAAE